MQKSGLVCSGETEKESLVEIIELCTSEHPWFLGVQFHPEFNSNPREGHPLFIEFIKAGITNSEKKLSKREFDAGPVAKGKHETSKL